MQLLTNSKSHAVVFRTLLLSMFAYNVQAQVNFPRCRGNDSNFWDACVGIKVERGKYVYKGEFQKGNKHGHGIYVVMDSYHRGNKYIGDFSHDMKEGLGSYLYANGDLYVGSFRSDQRNGRGVFTYKNGDKYDGEFRDDKRNGFGIFTKSNGTRYEGIWGNDVFQRQVDVTGDRGGDHDVRKPETKKNDIEKKGAIQSPSSSQIRRVRSDQIDSTQGILKVQVTNPDENGFVTLDINTGADTSSLLVNGKEEGGREDGQYKVRRVARIAQTTRFQVIATDIQGRKSEKTVSVYRDVAKDESAQELSPENIQARGSKDAIAIVIGVQNYKSLPPSEYSSDDAKLFFDYAIKTLGVRADHIRLLLDEQASEVEIIKTIQLWLPQHVHRHTTTVYVYFSGHGYLSDGPDGFYLLPYDSDKDLIERTGIKQSELLKNIENAAPNNSIIFLDSCFSGLSRSGNLIASNSRPLILRQAQVPLSQNVNVLSASKYDEVSYSSKSLKHGIFSYYLMRGLGGDADLNGDRSINLGELHEYLQKTVPKHASTINKSQNPQLHGDPDLVVVGN